MNEAALQDACEAELARLWAANADGAHDLGHVRRVLANARRIAQDEGGADETVLIPAAILHDAVNLPKDHPHRARASRLSGRVAAEFLATLPFDPAAKIAAVAHAIEAHSFSAAIAPETREAEILQDADRLEALGAIGLARMFLIAGQMGGALFDPEDPLARNRSLDDRRFALDHLEVKLFPVAATMRTPAGRAMAQERVEWMEAFRARLLREAQ